MDKKSKILLLVLTLSLIYAVGAVYYNTFIAKSYIIATQVECDPTVEECSVYTCSPDESSGYYDSECPEAEEERISYFKVIRKKLADIPAEVADCDSYNNLDCPQMSCEEGEDNCESIGCDLETLNEDQSCTTPEEYNLAHPEEEVVCEEGDESCVVDETEIEACAEGDENCVPEEVASEEVVDQSNGEVVE